MIKEYTRATHNFNNKIRGWKPSKKLKGVCNPPGMRSLGIHAMRLGSWSTFEEICELHLSTPAKVIQEELDELVRLGLVVMKETNL